MDIDNFDGHCDFEDQILYPFLYWFPQMFSKPLLFPECRSTAGKSPSCGPGEKLHWHHFQH